jgi:hypothetical protein
MHLASNVLSERIREALDQLGFRHDKFVAGTAGVLHPHHLSKHPNSREEQKTLWDQTTALLGTAGPEEFFGYVEAEVVSPDYYREFAFHPFEESVPVPIGPVHNEECPLDAHKDFDFHISADIESLDRRLEEVLGGELYFYHVDILKVSGKKVRVFTFQPMGTGQSPTPCFEALGDYLAGAGGFAGKLKMEATFAYARFPLTAPVPPVVRQMPELKTEAALRSCQPRKHELAHR